MKNLLLFLSVILTGTEACWGQAAVKFLDLPFHSAALTDDALSTIVNPSGLGVEGGEAFYLLLPYQSRADFGDWGIALGGECLGFTAEIPENSAPDARRCYTWGAGWGRRGCYLGFSYSWFSRLNRQNNWDLGLMLKPYSFLNFGLVARGINRPRIEGLKSHIGYDLGAAVYPLKVIPTGLTVCKSRLVLTCDLELRKFDRMESIEAEAFGDNPGWKIGLKGEVIPGVTLYADWLNRRGGVESRDRQWWMGLGLDFGKFGMGFRHQERNGCGASWLRWLDIPRPTWLKPHPEEGENEADI